MPGPRRFRSPSRIPRTVLVVAALVALALSAPRPTVADMVTDIEVSTDETGRTVVVVTGTESFNGRRYRSYPISDPPRAVVVLTGIDSSFLPRSISVADPNVIRIRVGHHPENQPPELHFVFDLETDDVEILQITHDRKRLTVVVGLPGAPVPPVATPTPAGTGDRPAPPDFPPPREEPTPLPPVTTSPPPAEGVLATSTPQTTETVATYVTDIAAAPRGDGSTLLRVTADGQLPEGCARYLKIADNPPRVVLSIRGVSAPELPRSIEIGDPNLTKIRLIHDAEVTEGELHLVLHLADAAVDVGELKQVGPHLVLRLVAVGTPSPTP